MTGLADRNALLKIFSIVSAERTANFFAAYKRWIAHHGVKPTVTHGFRKLQCPVERLDRFRAWPTKPGIEPGSEGLLQRGSNDVLGEKSAYIFLYAAEPVIKIVV